MAQSNETNNAAENVASLTIDNPDMPIVIPHNKLDADQYAADDLDGVTESLFGSGNMAYAYLQASQTNDLLQNGDGFQLFDPANALDGGQGTATGVADSGFQSGARLESTPLFSKSNNISADADRASDQQGSINSSNTGGSFTAATVGTLGASQLSSDIGRFNATNSSISTGSGSDGAGGANGADGDVPLPPIDGKDGKDGINAEAGYGDTFIDIDITFGDTIVMIDNVLINLGDTVNTLVVSLTEITNTINNIIGDTDIFNIINLDIISDILNDFTINNILQVTLNEINNLTTNITNILTDLLGTEGLELNLDLNVLDTLLTDVNVPFDNPLGADINVSASLDKVKALLDELADLSSLDALSNTLGTLGGTVDTLQSSINELTDIVSNIDLSDPTGTLGDTVETITSTLENLEQTIGDVVATVDEAVGGVLNELGIGDVGDTAEGIVGDVLNGLGDLGGDQVDDGLLSQTADPLVGDIADVLGDLTGGASDDLTDTLEGAVDSLTDLGDTITEPLLGGVLGTGNDNEGGTDSDIVANLGIDALDNSIVDDAVNVALDPIEDLAGDIDIGLNLGIDLLGSGGEETSNLEGDSDITMNTGIDLVDTLILSETADIPLDPIENATGDIDLDTGVAVNLLDDFADPTVNDGAGGTGEDTLLSEAGDTLGEVGSGLLSGELPEATEELSAIDGALLDDLAGEQDIDLGETLDILDSAEGLADTLVNTLTNDNAGGDDIAAWTETISDGGGLFDDIANGLGGGESDALPDPVGTVSEGLGALDIDNNLDVLGSGGLFG